MPKWLNFKRKKGYMSAFDAWMQSRQYTHTWSESQAYEHRRCKVVKPRID